MRRTNERGRTEQLCVLCGRWYLLYGWAAHAASEKKKRGHDAYAKWHRAQAKSDQASVALIEEAKRGTLLDFK